MRAAILEEIDDQCGLRYEGARARPYRWIHALTSYGVLRPDIEKLFNEWWRLNTIGRSVAFFQYMSCLMYSENENPIFGPWTPNAGGGPTRLSEFAGHLYKHCWLLPNVEFLRSTLTKPNVEQHLHGAVKMLQNEPEFSVASQVESDWPLCADFLVSKCAELCEMLATKH